MVILRRLVGEANNEGEHGGDDGVEECGEGDEDTVVDESNDDEDERDSEIDDGNDDDDSWSGSADISCNFLLFRLGSSIAKLWSSPNM